LSCSRKRERIKVRVPDHLPGHSPSDLNSFHWDPSKICTTSKIVLQAGNESCSTKPLGNVSYPEYNNWSSFKIPVPKNTLFDLSAGSLYDLYCKVFFI
jgi:hypothetical protein